MSLSSLMREPKPVHTRSIWASHRASRSDAPSRIIGSRNGRTIRGQVNSPYFPSEATYIRARSL